MRSLLERIAGLRRLPNVTRVVVSGGLAAPALAGPPGARQRPDLALLLEDRLPAFMFDLDFLQLQLWQWLGLLLLVGIAAILAWMIGGVVRRLLQPVVQSTETLLDDEILVALYPPGRGLLTIGLFAVGSRLLGLPEAAHSALGAIEITLVVIVATWMLLRLISVLSRFVEARLEANDRRAAVAVVPLGTRTLKAFLFVIAGLALLQNLGFNVTGLIAGLGVGGLAVALAAQKTVANLFGGVSIIADQPVRVGDFCRFGDNQVGTVEEIGIRSTRIRSPDRTIVTVPNSDFSERLLENFAMRDRLKLLTTIGLRYETTPDQLRRVLVELRKMLVAHPRVFEELRRVRFVGFGAHSLDLEIFTYVLTQDYNEFLAIREDIFLRIMEIVDRCGSGFAFPSQTLYLGRDTGLDAERQQRAEQEVAALRDGKRLPFPDFAPETIGEIAALEYPPAGSETPPREPG